MSLEGVRKQQEAAKEDPRVADLRDRMRAHYKSFTSDDADQWRKTSPLETMFGNWDWDKLDTAIGNIEECKRDLENAKGRVYDELASSDDTEEKYADVIKAKEELDAAIGALKDYIA